MSLSDDLAEIAYPHLTNPSIRKHLRCPECRRNHLVEGAVPDELICRTCAYQGDQNQFLPENMR